MKESSYVSTFSSKLEDEEGGKVLKIADKATLGLPDSCHIRNGIITYFETKVSDDYQIIDNVIYVQPWKIVKKDLRQFEVCKIISRYALVVYCIYWFNLKKSVVLTISQLACLRSEKDQPFQYLYPSRLEDGHGVERLRQLMKANREGIYERLQHEHGTNGQGFPH